MSDQPRVLVAHNRYRVAGGEERAVEAQLAALARAGVVHEALIRDSAGAGRVRAARALLAGGERPELVARAVRELAATILHVHNMHPLIGPRALRAAREAGARVVLHLHNFRLFCAIGVAFRDGAPCFRCRGRQTLPGLALNCRGSLPEAATYAAALAAHQPTVLDCVDRFVAPSVYAAGQLARLGVPAERMSVLPHYLPADAVSEGSRAHRGQFALVSARLAHEKGIATAIEAAALAGVPVKLTGAGPLESELRALAGRLGAPVELLGRVESRALATLRARAAMAVVPSRSGETFGLTALEAMGAGLPVVATDAGALPEIVGRERVVARGDVAALATAIDALWRDPRRRRAEGEWGRARARERYGEERYIVDLLGLYRDLG